MLVKEWGGVWASVWAPIAHYGLTAVLTMARKPYITLFPFTYQNVSLEMNTLYLYLPKENYQYQEIKRGLLFS